MIITTKYNIGDQIANTEEINRETGEIQYIPIDEIYISVTTTNGYEIIYVGKEKILYKESIDYRKVQDFNRDFNIPIYRCGASE